MFGIITKKDKRTDLEKEIHSVLCNMSTYSPDDEEYTVMSKNLETLYKAKALEKDKGVKPEVIFNGVVFLAGTALVLYFEKANVITSKAFGAVFKGRV